MQNNIYKMGPTLHNVELESFEEECNQFESNTIVDCNKLDTVEKRNSCYKCKCDKLDTEEKRNNCYKYESKCNKLNTEDERNNCFECKCNKLNTEKDIDTCYKDCIKPSPGLLAGILAIIYFCLFFIIPFVYSQCKNSNKKNDITEDIYNKIN